MLVWPPTIACAGGHCAAASKPSPDCCLRQDAVRQALMAYKLIGFSQMQAHQVVHCQGRNHVLGQHARTAGGDSVHHPVDQGLALLHIGIPSHLTCLACAVHQGRAVQIEALLVQEALCLSDASLLSIGSSFSA